MKPLIGISNDISRSSGRRWKDETAAKCIDCSFRDRHYGCLHGI